MIAMQYSIILPADYDMAIIRRRVAERGAAFDTLDGLRLKAFLIAERGVHGSAENLYAPMYVWRSAAAMADFLCGDKFKAVCQAFGRPTVRTWTILHFDQVRGGSVPGFASREIVRVSPSTDLGELRTRELLSELNGRPAASVDARLIALDPASWELLRFTLTQQAPEADRLPTDAQHYEVLHLSVP